MNRRFLSANTILYCRKWRETVAFYRDGLALPVLFSNDWFVEFGLSENARLSVADESRSAVKSGSGSGITISIQTEDLDLEWERMIQNRLCPSPIRSHPWNARVFYIHDPEGHRIEFWRAVSG